MTGKCDLAFFCYFEFVLTVLLLSRPPSPSKKRVASSVVSPAISTPAVPSESGGSGSARGQSASGLSGVPKFIKPKKFMLKQSSQSV